MKKLIYPIVVLCISLSIHTTYANETKISILKKELESLNINNPKQDFATKVGHDDFRFFGLYGYTQYFPGIKEDEYKFVEEYGKLMFEGTSDAIESDEHGKLIQKARLYAEIYNTTLLTYLKKYNFKPKDGYIPDKETAIKIAIAIWTPIYGKKEIEKQKPYNAALDSGIWFVSGSLPKGWHGGVAEAEIIKENGKIIRISHGK